VEADWPRTIARALRAAGLRPDPKYFDYIRARMYHHGELEYQSLIEKAGPELEHRALHAIRQLGFGHVITEFAIAHLGIPGKPDRAVLSLGALSNLIVSMYDGLLDSGQDPERILPRSRITGIAGASKTGDPLLGTLVDLYFARLSAFPNPHAAVYQTLRSAIVRMYDAERATSGPLGYTRTVWRRKSALPIVIMGLPVWMTVPLLEICVYRAHLKWLFRLGQFIGWIDDAADIHADRAAGRPNYFSAGAGPNVARRIAGQGALIVEAWNTGAPRGRYGRTLLETFLAVTWSWLGVQKT
jgi:hypothetical protein